MILVPLPPPQSIVLCGLFSRPYVGLDTPLPSQVYSREIIKLALAVIVSCLAVLFREHLLHSPPANHININFITYWFFYTNKFPKFFSQIKKQRILKVFTIFFHFSHQTIASFLITTTLTNKSGCFFCSIRFQL